MLTTVDDAEISAFFAAEPATIAWPYPMYRRWQQGSGVLRWEGGPAVLLTRHADVKAAMGGAFPLMQNGYRHGRLAEGIISRLPPHAHDIFFTVMDFESLFLSRHDGEEHARLRRISARGFTARRMESLREAVQRHVDDLLDEMGIDTLGSADVVDIKTGLADKLPVRVIVDMLGVPQADREMIWEWSEAIAAVFSVDEGTLRRADAALRDFSAYVRGLIEAVRGTDGGPEIARLMLEGRDREALSDDELVAMYLLILFGGSETTTNLLGNGFLALQRNRDQWDALVADRSLLRGGIDELMRYDSPHHYLPRVATADFTVGGVDVAAGETVIIVMGAANRDPDVFEDPERLDVTRHNRGEQLSFAFGVHHCLGAALARIEGEVVLGTLLERFPDAVLVEDAPTYRGSAMLRAIEHLPTRLHGDAQ